MSKGIARRADFDPADYSTVGFFYLGDDEEIQYEYGLDHGQLIAQGHGGLIETAGHCDSCGTGYLHGAVVEGPEGFLAVGGICAAEYFGVASIADHKRNEAAKARQRKATKAAGEQAIIDHDLLKVDEMVWKGDPVDFPATDAYLSRGFPQATAYDILRKTRLYGSISEGQVNLLHKLYDEHFERLAEKAAAEAEAPPVAIPSDIVGVRSTIEATVLGTKWQESFYGDTHKMLVKVEADGGSFKLWGTVPSKLDGTFENEDGDHVYVPLSKGDKVRFDAKVERSSDDEAFGFFSRPTNPEVIERAAVDA